MNRSTSLRIARRGEADGQGRRCVVVATLKSTSRSNWSVGAIAPVCGGGSVAVFAGAVGSRCVDAGKEVLCDGEELVVGFELRPVAAGGHQHEVRVGHAPGGAARPRSPRLSLARATSRPSPCRQRIDRLQTCSRRHLRAAVGMSVE